MQHNPSIQHVRLATLHLRGLGAEVRRLGAATLCGFLVGEACMTAVDPGRKLTELFFGTEASTAFRARGNR